MSKEEIEIGEYVRLRNGEITKVIAVNDNTFSCNFQKINCELFIDYIVKHSNNIIDLIEEGDIVEIDIGKYEVIFDKSYQKLGILIPSKNHLEIRHCSLQHIFSENVKKEFEQIKIVTKEQFEERKF